MRSGVLEKSLTFRVASWCLPAMQIAAIWASAKDTRWAGKCRPPVGHIVRLLLVGELGLVRRGSDQAGLVGQDDGLYSIA